MASSKIMLEGEAADAKRRRLTGGPEEAQQLGERMDSLRLKIKALAAYKQFAAAQVGAAAAAGGGGGGGSPFGEKLLDLIENHRRDLLRSWLRLASWKVDVDLSGMNEADLTPEACRRWKPPPVPKEPVRRPTLQEANKLQKRMDLLGKEIQAAISDERFVRDEIGGTADGVEFLLRAEKRRRGFLLELWHLDDTPRSPDLSLITEAERAAEAERLRQEGLQEARHLRDNGDTHGASHQEALARITDFDAKQGGFYFSSLSLVADLATFDHTEESPVGPMRFSNRVYEDKLFVDYAAINILSVKIACSDTGFPIQVYGTVIARDCIDYKCVYLFRRDNDHAQLIDSEEEALILIGPKRALALSRRDDYVETDLWVKDRQGHCREFSKGVIRILGTRTQSLDKCEAEKVSLATRLSTVDVIYDVVKCAVEATVAVEVVQGEFYGVVTAHTTSSERRIVLYDSKVAGGNCYGVIQLMRPAISVYVMDKLMITAKTTAGDCAADLKFNPYWNGGKEGGMNLGDTRMHVRVCWSMME